MKIGLLECDHVRAELNHIAGDYRDMFPALFNPHVPDIEFENFDVCNGKFPATVDDCDAYLATGSQSSAYDPDDWIQSLMGFVRQLSDANKRYVGICFGHQILAQALGGEVTPAPQGWGAGVHQLKVVNTESWMLPPQTTCNIQYTHGDQVRRLPEQSVVLGESDHCPVAMFRIRETMLGIQGHPEFSADYARSLILKYANKVGEEKLKAADFTTPTDGETFAKWIAGFLKA